MKVLVPLLTGKENNKDFIEVFTQKVDEVIVLQIVDRDFMARTSSAIGEVRQSKALMEELKKIIGLKKKKCEEVTEWGATIQKIIGIAFIQKIDKIFFIKQENQFFEDILKELKKKKINFELFEVKENEEKENEK